MASIRNIIGRFIDWAIKLREADKRNERDPNTLRGLYSGSARERIKATEIVDEKVFGIHKNKR